MKVSMKATCDHPKYGWLYNGCIYEVSDEDGEYFLKQRWAIRAEELVESSERWTLSISPGDYLRRFPAGPNAPLARRLLKR